MAPSAALFSCLPHPGPFGVAEPDAAPSQTSPGAVGPGKGAAASSERGMEKPPELIAFETGREVMEQLRNKHASVSQLLEYLCTDIGV